MGTVYPQIVKKNKIQIQVVSLDGVVLTVQILRADLIVHDYFCTKGTKLLVLIFPL